jgi:glyoxylase-like metal-dependent hydrolase (beta-lactamase superfamily II)
MARAFQPSGHKIRTSVNAFLVNTGAKLILIDTGAGNAFGPTLGFAVRNLKAAGYDPADVDKVLLTHMHGDHLGGILSTDGKIAFPNAALMPTRAESEYWLDAARMAQAPKEARGSFEMAAKTAAPYRAAGQWKPFDSNADIEPGIRAFATGHTPGHTSYIIESKGQRLIVLGDVIHFGSVQFPRPDISVVFDTDSAPAITSRKKLFAAAAKDQTLLAGAHLSFPGLGHIRAQGQGYVWVPVEFSPLR